MLRRFRSSEVRLTKGRFYKVTLRKARPG
jgi:hypothetical protein